MIEKKLEVWYLLMVDDDEEDYLITRCQLDQAQGRTIHLEWARTYQDGEALLQSNRYDAVLVDYDLGHSTGIKLISKATAQGYPAPFILYTGRGSYAVDLEAMQAGATLYLTKGETTALLLERSIRYAIERKRIEQDRLDMLASIQGGFIVYDRDWCIVYINRQAAQKGGFEPEELVGRSIWEISPNLVGTRLEQNYRRAMEERQPVTFEQQSVYLGQQVWYLISVSPSHQGISVHWQDISEQKQSQFALEESERAWRQSQKDLAHAQAMSHTGSWRLDTRKNELHWSEEAYRIFGVLPGTAITYDDFLATVHPFDRAAVDRSWNAALKGEPYDIEHRILVGEQVKWVREWAELEFDGQGELLGGFGTVQDITGWKLSQEALSTSEAVLAQAGQMAHLGAWKLDISNAENINANPLHWSDEVYRIFGYEPGAVEASNELFFAHVHPEDQPAVAAAVAQAIEEQRDYQIEHRIIRSDGTQRIVMEHAEIKFDEHGRPLQMVGAVQDITEQKQTEQALKAYASQLKSQL